jgi:hypothetical protein
MLPFILYLNFVILDLHFVVLYLKVVILVLDLLRINIISLKIDIIREIFLYSDHPWEADFKLYIQLINNLQN